MQPPALELILNNALKRASGKDIAVIHLIVGELIDMTDESILASWQTMAKGTLAEGAALHIHRVPAELQCMACFQKYHPNSTNFSCPRCGSVGAKVITGEEFFVERVELDS